MPDQFPQSADAVFAPSRSIFALTPSDTTDYLTDAGRIVPKALRVGNAGNLVVVAVDDPVGSPVTIPNVQAGETISIRVRRVMATGTTASGIIAFD